jgi:hypothetical protein
MKVIKQTFQEARSGTHTEKLSKRAAREKRRLAPTAYQYKTQLLWRFTITMFIIRSYCCVLRRNVIHVNQQNSSFIKKGGKS